MMIALRICPHRFAPDQYLNRVLGFHCPKRNLPLRDGARQKARLSGHEIDIQFQ